MKKIIKTNNEWQEELTEEEFIVTRAKGTERAFTGEYYDCSENGLYLCRCCEAPLFDSETKFDSGTGWPSFTKPITAGSVETDTDKRHNIIRVEVHCARCNAHLGHVFNDGPSPGGKRYCMNSISLKLKKR